MTETIVIAGGPGSFGWHLPGRLLAGGRPVSSLDNVCTGVVIENSAFGLARYDATGIRLAGRPAR